MWIGLKQDQWVSGQTSSYSNSPLPNAQKSSHSSSFQTGIYGSMTNSSWQSQAETYSYTETRPSRGGPGIVIRTSPLNQKGIIEINLNSLNQNLSTAKQELQTALNNQSSALQAYQNFESNRTNLDAKNFGFKYFDLIGKLSTEIGQKSADLVFQIDLTNDQQELFIETNLQQYIQTKEYLSEAIVKQPVYVKPGTSEEVVKYLQISNQKQAITGLENLRLEIAYLTSQAEKNPDTVQTFLQEYQAGDKTATTLQTLRDKYYPELNQATTLAALQTQINNEISQSQQQIEQLKASITQKQAQSAAALSQADWYHYHYPR